MSVTFHAYETPKLFVISCSCGAANAVTPYATYQDAVDARTVGVTPVCGDDFCAAYPVMVKAEELAAPEVNMSNINAREVITMLGLSTEDLCGTLQASDLLGRILIAQAVAPRDAGIPATQEGNFVYGGREEGYTDDRLIELLSVAEYAAERNLVVSFG